MDFDEYIKELKNPTLKLNIDGKEIIIDGDIKNISFSGDIVINGNIATRFSCDGDIFVNGDVDGTIIADGSVNIQGNYNGPISDKDYKNFSNEVLTM